MLNISNMPAAVVTTAVQPRLRFGPGAALPAFSPVDATAPTCAATTWSRTGSAADAAGQLSVLAHPGLGLKHQPIGTTVGYPTRAAAAGGELGSHLAREPV